MPWYVLYTNPRAEKKVAQQLAAMDVEVYCPLIVKVQQWSDRKKKVELPLFSSYVFVNIDDNEREKVFAAKGVVRYLFWLGRPAVVKDSEIATIKQWLSTDYTEVETENLVKGQEVEIKDGPFKNLTGVVQDINRNTVRIMVQSVGVIVTLKYNKLPASAQGAIN